MAENDVPDMIIAMERAALTRWGSGDPSGFLEISAPDVVYFDPYAPRRVDGLAALKECYRPIRGKIFFDRFELLNPNVQLVDKMAVLTFNYVSYKGDGCDRWNCTEVYRKENDGRWMIIQSHWSYTEVFNYKMQV
jgi:ketosteroid isomerase-like protein